MSTSRIETLVHDSKVLKNNPLGDPSVRRLPVYLPPGYDDDPQTRYPVIWVLAPFTGWGERLLNVQAWDDNIAQRLDKLIAAGRAQPTILAFPNCFTRYGGSQYLNSAAVGPYDDYLTQELVPFLDQTLRTLPARDHRGVMGHSSGGYGALMAGLQHSDLFSAVACHSGDMLFEQCYWPDIPGAVRQWEAAGGVEKFLRGFVNIRDKGKDWGSALSLVAMSACYSSNPAHPLGFDLLCDPYSGEIDRAIWKKWQDLDPVRIAEKSAPTLRSLRLLFFDCGLRDEYNLFLGARLLHATLTRAEVPHRYEEFDGGHQRVNWRYEVSLPLLIEALMP